MFEVRLKMEPDGVIMANLGIEPNGRVQRFFTNTCARHMDKYVPYDTGTLASTVEVGSDTITYDQPYAKVVYYGIRNGKPLNYSTDKHPLACSYWDRQMVSAEMQDIVKEVQDYARMGGL